ncbi:MAG TPA: 50S ribosomal protein L17 [Candidatus Krumholzibacteria bacterium]|nr:50S ribosomal protein L17 [Candidatus Krumholzibacteria bacterium]HPD72082.1 50S ribosomal protein L17 [Candidatus Krumholzibacteria bacterium]HRY40986.1 50S ribosomal protein L17 [Candidatus Krumholzibacteria bacterium]
MRHNYSGRKLSRTSAHRKMLYRNLVTALFEHERIQTTAIKAKEARSLAEKLITFAKRGDLHARRQAARKVNDPQVLRKLFDEIAPRYAERPGGYTRILRLSGGRKGDNAEMAILELVDSSVRPKSLDTRKRKQARRILKAEEKAEAKAALLEAAEEREHAAEEPEAETGASEPEDEQK